MVRRALTLWLVATALGLTLGAANARACFPMPGFEPSVTRSTLSSLPAAEPAVVAILGEFTLRLPAAALLTVLEDPDLGSANAERDLERALARRLPLTADLPIENLREAVIPNAARRSPNDHELRNARARAQERLSYATAALLERGDAVVIQDGAVLESLVREEYREKCRGGRRFLTEEGAVVLQVVDWIS